MHPQFSQVPSQTPPRASPFLSPGLIFAPLPTHPNGSTAPFLSPSERSDSRSPQFLPLSLVAQRRSQLLSPMTTNNPPLPIFSLCHYAMAWPKHSTPLISAYEKFFPVPSILPSIACICPLSRSFLSRTSGSMVLDCIPIV